MSARLRKVAKELESIEKDRGMRCEAQPVDGKDLSHLAASFLGPRETPYEDGTFLVDIKIPEKYPFHPPEMKLITKIWHPNISSQTGAICLDTLSTGWSPVQTIGSLLLSLQSLLASPEPRDPMDEVVAKMLREDRDHFERMARNWAIRYADAPDQTQWEMKRSQTSELSKKISRSLSAESFQKDQILLYQGYNENLVRRFTNMGFEIERVIEAFLYFKIDCRNGQYYELEDHYYDDLTTHLLGDC